MVEQIPTKKKTRWYVDGLHFECQQCGRCCCGPDEGYIWVTKPEIKFIADFLKETVEQLHQKYLKRQRLRTTIIECPVTKDCIFLREIASQKRCSIYPVRPNQCRTWPFWSNNLANPNAWNGAAQKCLGVNRGKHCSYEEIEKIRKTKKWWT